MWTQTKSQFDDQVEFRSLLPTMEFRNPLWVILRLLSVFLERLYPSTAVQFQNHIQVTGNKFVHNHRGRC